MITVVAALKGELAPLLSVLKIEKKVKINAADLYIAKEALHLLRVGVGGENCRKSMMNYLADYRPEAIINIGIAGIINQKTEQGDIFSVTKVVHPLRKAAFKLPVSGEFKNASLLTLDSALADEKLRDNYCIKYGTDLADMEGWFCAQIAAEYHIPFKCWKIAGDRADKNAEKDFLKNYKLLSQKLAQKVKSFLI